MEQACMPSGSELETLIAQKPTAWTIASTKCVTTSMYISPPVLFAFCFASSIS